MSTITFYRWSLLTPIALPVAMLAFIGGNGDLAGLAQLFLMSLLYGGIPYVLTVALLSRPLLYGNERQYTLLTWVAPLVMIAVQTVGGFLLGMCLNPTDRWGGATGTGGLMFALGVYTLVFGYGYVALARIGLWLLRRMGLVH